jgi:hypothetical protein
MRNEPLNRAVNVPYVEKKTKKRENKYLHY